MRVSRSDPWPQRLRERLTGWLLDTRGMGRDLWVLFALTGWALAVPHYGSEFAVSMALSCLMYVALSTSWTLFCGSTRYLSLATSAFFGIGAYSGALALDQFSWASAASARPATVRYTVSRSGTAVSTRPTEPVTFFSQ